MNVGTITPYSRLAARTLQVLDSALTTMKIRPEGRRLKQIRAALLGKLLNSRGESFNEVWAKLTETEQQAALVQVKFLPDKWLVEHHEESINEQINRMTVTEMGELFVWLAERSTFTMVEHLLHCHSNPLVGFLDQLSGYDQLFQDQLNLILLHHFTEAFISLQFAKQIPSKKLAMSSEDVKEELRAEARRTAALFNQSPYILAKRLKQIDQEKNFSPAERLANALWQKALMRQIIIRWSDLE